MISYNFLRTSFSNNGGEKSLQVLSPQYSKQRYSHTTTKSLQSCPTLCTYGIRQPTRLPHPWDSPGKNTRVGCHFLLHCVKVKSESEVAQLCPTLHDPMDCSLPGSSVNGIFQASVLEWVAIAFSKDIAIDLCKYFSVGRQITAPIKQKCSTMR